MTFQYLLKDTGISLERTKLIRHNLSNVDVARNYKSDYLEIYQSVQSPTCFKNCDYVISFLGTEGTNGVFQGCYQVMGYSPFERAKLPEDFTTGAGMETDNNVIWNFVKTDILAEFIDRLVIDWGKGAINWRQNGTTAKEILEIRPFISEISFHGYDKVLLSYESLRKIVYNKASFKEWEDKLSAVAGVYLITDTKTGKHYVGSASGEGGIWSRWSDYAKTKHGGNTRLVALINDDPEYCYNFQYSILKVFPNKSDNQEILDCEKLYKKKLQSICFGLNDN